MQQLQNNKNFTQKSDDELLLELSIGRITFLSFEEKQILKKNLDSYHSLVLLSIEDICNIVNHKFNNRIAWNGKDNFECAKKSLRYCKQLDIRILVHDDLEYPELLRQIADPPYLLFCRGNVSLLSGRTVSVVGTRRLSPRGKSAALQFAYDAVMDGCSVVSGLAAGADCFAHQGAGNACFDCAEKESENTDANGEKVPENDYGKTIAVLPSSIDEIIPASNKRLAGQILQTGGLIISEYEPTMTLANWHFVGRNRIIAGLSSATVIIEAPVGSGALITADFALENGRDVFFHEAAFEQMAAEIGKIVKKDLENRYNQNLVSKYKMENTPEKYIEAGAPVIKNYKDFCQALKEIPGTRKSPVQGELF